MTLYCVLIFAAILLENEAKVHEGDVMREQRAAAEIARLIHLLHQQTDEQDLDKRSEPPAQSFAEDYFMVRTESPGDMEFQNAGNQAHSVRLHFIKNPNVLEEYKSRVKYKSDENGDTFSNDLHNSDRRRSALFRLGSSSIDTAVRSSDENILVPNRPKEKPKRNNDRNNVDIYLDNEDVRRKKGKDTQGNAWDVITKKYEWNKPKHQKKKNKMADDWDEVTQQNYDNFDKTTKRGRARMKKPKNDWESSERKPKEFDRSYENNKKKAAKDDDTQFKTTKWKSEPKANRNKAYVPSYDKPRKKSRDHFEASGMFGRTPIPFIGRQGIYAD